MHRSTLKNNRLRKFDEDIRFTLEFADDQFFIGSCESGLKYMIRKIIEEHLHFNSLSLYLKMENWDLSPRSIQPLIKTLDCI